MQSKPTEYNGQLFCSRGEVRWALILDHLKIPWQYEAEEYILPVTKPHGYNPDFLLPREGYYMEYKGSYKKEHLDVCTELATILGQSMIMTWGFVGWWLSGRNMKNGGAAIAQPGQDPLLDRCPCICPRCGNLEWPGRDEANPGCWYGQGYYGMSTQAALHHDRMVAAVDFQRTYTFMASRFIPLDRERFEDLQYRERQLAVAEDETRTLRDQAQKVLQQRETLLSSVEKEKEKILERAKGAEQTALARLHAVETCARYLPDLEQLHTTAEQLRRISNVLHQRVAPQQRPNFPRTRREFLRHRRHLSYSGGPG